MSLEKKPLLLLIQVKYIQSVTIVIITFLKNSYKLVV